MFISKRYLNQPKNHLLLHIFFYIALYLLHFKYRDNCALNIDIDIFGTICLYGKVNSLSLYSYLLICNLNIFSQK